MPSLFSFSSSKRSSNPYSNPHHPSHAPLPPKQSKLHSASQPNIAIQSATISTADTFLAEARSLANRDPVTGKLLPRPVMPSQTASETNFDSNARLNRAMNAVDRLGPSVERSAYLNRASQTQPISGNRYDLLSTDEKRKREEEEKMRRAMGAVEFYAPERKVSEFYGGVDED